MGSSVINSGAYDAVGPTTEVDGNGPASAVTGLNSGSYQGPMTILDGGSRNAPAFSTQSPLSQGQTAIYNGHVVGKVDNLDRANPPAVVRFQNLANQNRAA